MGIYRTTFREYLLSYVPGVLTVTLLLAMTGPAFGFLQTLDQHEEPAGTDVESDATPQLKDAPYDARPAQPVGHRKYEYKKFTNIIYSRGKDYTLLCDAYVPEGKGPFPAVLAIHGGAWRHGSKLQMLRHAWKMAGAGYVVVAINYRHAPKYKFPAQVHDSKAAVRWIRQKSEKLKVDTDRIAVFGYSAGGHLAAMLGTTDDGDDLEGNISSEQKDLSTRVHCVVVGGGPCEFDWIKSRALTDWLGDSKQENPDVYLKAAPLTYVTKDDPPFMFFHGGGDMVVPKNSSKKMHDRLTENGIFSAYHLVGEKGHFATFSDLTWMDDAIAFMDKTLERTHNE